MGKPLPTQLRPATISQPHAPAPLTVQAVEAKMCREEVTPNGLDRRSFLAHGAKAVAFLAAFQAMSRKEAQAAHGFDPFSYGVASGDPLPNRVIIWTRVNPSAAATPGSGLGAPLRGIWEVAKDANFTQRVAFGRFTTSPLTDHTVKIDVPGLKPYTHYFYRFHAINVYSPVGRTLTAPAVRANPASVRFGMVSCSNYEAGYFTAYRHLSQRDDLDFILHLGDYIYEYATGQYGPDGFAGVERVHDPVNEIVTLSDYRRRHALHKADPDLRALHHRHPFITTWDDHETANNAWRDGAENHTPGEEGSWAARKRAGIQAYFEWMPLRPSPRSSDLGEVRRVYRKFTFGALVEFFMLDLRQYRAEQPGTPTDTATINDPTRSLLGSDQGQWFQQNLVGSRAQWKLIGNSVQIAPVIVIPALLPPATAALIEAIFGVPASSSVPTPLNVDSWDGYGTSRLQVLGLIGGLVTGTPIPNCVFLTGDIHSSYACDLPANPATYGSAPVSLATEFVCTSVTSDNINEIVGAPERVSDGMGGYIRNPVTPGFELLLRSFNAWIKDVNLDFHGYSVVDVSSARVQVDNWVLRSDVNPFFAADPRQDPDAACVFSSAFQTATLTQAIQPASSPLGPRV